MTCLCANGLRIVCGFINLLNEEVCACVELLQNAYYVMHYKQRVSYVCPWGSFENTSSENFRKVFRETSVQYIFDGKVAGIRLVTLQKNNYAF